MAASGEAGAQKLIDAFARPPDLASDHFTYHRWVRARSLLERAAADVARHSPGRHRARQHPPYPDLIRDAPAYVGSSYRLSDGARDAAARLLDALDALDRELEAGNADVPERRRVRRSNCVSSPCCDDGGRERPGARAAEGHFDVVVDRRRRRRHDVRRAGGQRGRRVLLIEHYHVVGEKIRISGGGRCNFTNVERRAGELPVAEPGFLPLGARALHARAFHRAGRAATASRYHEKKLGQLFCDDSSREIIAMLKAECDARRRALARCRARSTASVGRGERLRRRARRMATFACASLVIATGGLTVPKIGATPFGYRIAEQFGLPVVPPRPALVPLAFAPDALARYGDLSGVSRRRRGRVRRRAGFARTCCSRIAACRVRRYCRSRRTGTGARRSSIDLLPGVDARAWLLRAARRRMRASTTLLARAAAEARSRSSGAPRTTSRCRCVRSATRRSTRIACSAASTGRYCRRARSATTRPKSRRAAWTRASCRRRRWRRRAVPGLYFIGEVVDVTGWLGGYNFQWAWASGHAAGQVV